MDSPTKIVMPGVLQAPAAIGVTDDLAVLVRGRSDGGRG
jgi:hypothetical protein